MHEVEDKKELGHEPVPGYRTTFFIIFGLSVLYLALVFIKTM